MAVARGKFRDELSAPVWALVTLSAVGIAIAGYLHGPPLPPRLRAGGVGGDPLSAQPGSLPARRSCCSCWAVCCLFAIGALFISGGSIVAILFSHSSAGFFGFHENAYDTQAKIIVAAEIVAIVAIGLAWILARGRLFRARLPRETA